MSVLKFSEDHEWIKVEGDEGTVGISAYAQEALGDVVFVELPEAGAMVSRGDEVAVVESVKAASEVYAPASGQITDANTELDADPSLVNSSPFDDGWFFKMKLSDAGELDAMMDEAEYEAFIKDLS